NHFTGELTKKLSAIAPHKIHYAPAFLYDNQNDYGVYLFVVFLFCINYSVFFKQNLYLVLISLFSLFLFSFTGDARIMSYLIGVLILFVLAQELIKLELLKATKNKIVVALAIASSIILIINKPIFLGPKYQTDSSFYRMRDMQDFEKQFGGYDSIGKVENSFVVRLKFIKNGLLMIQENPILGVGPGQYKTVHRLKKVKYDTGTNVSPHNFPVEIISEYGVFGWGYIGLLGYFFYLIFQLRYKHHHEVSFWLWLSIPLFCVVSIIPSSFLYFDIMWLFAPLLYFVIRREYLLVSVSI
ncbi:MAG: O-antigen ligase family protein, partial [Bacteroidia bacterium]